MATYSQQQHPVVDGLPTRHLSSSTASTAGASAKTDIEKQAGLNHKPVEYPDDVRSRAGSGDSQVDGETAEKGLTWWQAAFYMIAYNISIGILALPKAFSDLGLAGGLIFLIPYACINYFTSRIVWQVTLRYGLYSYPDMLGLIFGRYGKWLGHVVQSLLQGFLTAVHVMTMRKAISAISAPRYVVCAVWWTFLGAAVMFLCSLYRSLKDWAWLAILSCASILAATIITIVSVVLNGGGIADHYAFLSDKLSSATAVGSGISSVVFAFTGHLAYPQIINEMKKPEDFRKSLKANAIVQAVMYAGSACVIYWFAGDAVDAPAIDSATGLLSKLAWGLALPTIVVAGVLPGMMIIKNANRGFWNWRGQQGVPWENSWRARLSWTAIAAVLWIIAPIFAEVVPSFMGMVGVAGAFLGSWISEGFPALGWFRLDRQTASSRPRACSDRSDLPIAVRSGPEGRSAGKGSGLWAIFRHQAQMNARQNPYIAGGVVLIFMMGIILCVFGAHGAISDMAIARKASAAMHPFSCRAPGSLDWSVGGPVE